MDCWSLPRVTADLGDENGNGVYGTGGGDGALIQSHCKCAWVRYTPLMSRLDQVSKAMDYLLPGLI